MSSTNDTNPFSALVNYQKLSNKLMANEPRARQKAGLVIRKKGDPLTPNMQFAGKINWLVRMLTSIALSGYISQLRDHPARKNLLTSDEMKLRAFEERALELQRLANDLQVEIAAWNKKKKMRKIVE